MILRKLVSETVLFIKVFLAQHFLHTSDKVFEVLFLVQIVQLK